MGLLRNAHKILVGKPEEKRDHVEELGVVWRALLEWILGTG
jgi:hypothetical protein